MTLKEKIIEQLSVNYDKTYDNIIDLFIEDYKKIASFNSNRKEDDNKLEPYIKNAVVEAILRLGSEHTTSSSEGSQNYSFVDIEEKLIKDSRAIRKLC